MARLKKIAIIGAGVGGLALAVRLAYRGFAVEVYEKLPACGGRNNLIEDRGFKFDTGPSFVLMPDFFSEIFSSCGRDIGDYLDLKALDINYKIFYSDGQTLTVYSDNRLTKNELERIEQGSSSAYDNFIEETARIYGNVRPLLYDSFTWKSILNPAYWPLLTRIKPLRSYWQLARKYFKSEKIVFAFTFEAMFMGVSPFEAPAFYSIISYVDQVQKIFHPLGGMYQIPLSLEGLAKSFGVKFYYNQEVRKIISGHGGLTVKTDNSEASFDKIAVNADYAYAQTDLLGRDIAQYKYSCSVFLIYLGLKRKVRHLAHHNLFFAADLKQNLDQIFKEGAMPADPSFYVHVPTVTDTSLAPYGKEILYILIPVANLEDPQDDILAHEKRLRKAVFEKLRQVTGENVEDMIEIEHRFYPQDFILRYNIKYGATFGLAHNLMQSAFFRPANFDPREKNLYFVGASTQPGGGLPVVIAGSKITADLIQR